MSLEFNVDQMHCSSCVKKVEDALLPLAEVTQVKVDLLSHRVMVDGGDSDQIIAALNNLGYPAQLIQAPNLTEVDIHIANLHNEKDKEAIVQALESVVGIESFNLDCDTKLLQISGTVRFSALLIALAQANYPGTIQSKHLAIDVNAKQREINACYRRSIVAVIMGAALMCLGMLAPHWSVVPSLQGYAGSDVTMPSHLFWGLLLILTLITMIYSGRHYYSGAWRALRHKSLNMDSLIALGTGTAWLYSAIAIVFAAVLPADLVHVYLDTSVLILAFLNFGNALETKAKGKTSAAISKLIGLQPDSAILLHDDLSLKIPVDYLSLGDIVRVFPGGKVPVDGAVVAGQSRVNESMLTGEPVSRAKKKNDLVYAGTLNENGSLDVRVGKPNDETALAKIIALVRSAQASKPAIGKLVDRVSAIFVPVVIAIAILTFIVWSFFSMDHALTAAIAVLVIACPCALGLGTPIAMMVGTGMAAEAGILIRNGEALQAASGLSYVVFDKTGTITAGRPSVVDSYYVQSNHKKINAYVYALESHSEHPLAGAMMDFVVADKKNIALSDFKAVSARGISAQLEGKRVLLGNAHWMQDNEVTVADKECQSRLQQFAEQGATPILLAVGHEIMAVYAIADPIKADAKAAIAALHQLGIKTAMISGDNTVTANAIAHQVGINTIFAEVTPEEKGAYVARLQQQGEVVAMVGDGINDAPALTQANVGFAIGGGTDVAIESADMCLASDSLDAVRRAIVLSRATLHTIKKTLVGAFAYNSIGVLVAAGVLYPVWHILLSPIIASAAMAASSVTVVVVASSLRKAKI